MQKGLFLSINFPVAICVPARDEQDELPAFLNALAELECTRLDISACVFLDGCSDNSAAILRDAKKRFPFPLFVEHGAPTLEPNAGRARRAAMAIGAATLERRDGVLLSTDADSRPRHNWLRAAVRALTQADIVAGRIVRIAAERDIWQSRIELYYDRLHAYRRLLDPVPWDTMDGCHFSGAANMAIRASTYRLLGGFAPVPSGEDALMLDEAARAGLRVRHEPAMIVRTSSRHTGRASGGLATALSMLARQGTPSVAPPGSAIWQYQRHAAARRAFARIEESDERGAFGASIGLSGDHVLGVARDCPNAEAFAMRVVPVGPGHDAMVPLPEAEAMIAELERTWCRGAA